MIELNATWRDAVRPGRRIGHAIEAHATIGSTNERARELLGRGAEDGLVVVADEQTAGRGRMGRGWHSPAGRSLSASVVLRRSIDAAEAWRLSLAAALAAAAACDPVAPVTLKWPNDVVAPDGRKVGGILIETAVEGERLVGAVVGIGLNVDWERSAMPHDIRDRAVSLAELAATPVDRVALLARLLDALGDEVDLLDAGVIPLERYAARCATIGARVTVDDHGRRVEGLATGLDERGGLVVEALDGRHHFVSGEVSAVRGVAGP